MTPPRPPTDSTSSQRAGVSTARRLALPLLAGVVVLLIYVFGRAPSEVLVVLDLGTDAPLDALAADCVDAAGLSSSGRWRFLDAHPPQLELRVLTSGGQYRCEFDLRRAGERRSVTRLVDAGGSDVRVLLAAEIDKLTVGD